MLKKLMSSIVIGSIVLSMVGCTATNESDKQQAQDIINSTKQEQQVQPKEKEVKKEQEQPKQEPKQQPKEQPKEQQSKPKESKKKQNDNIDADTGLAKVKDGTHLGEEANKQDKQNEDDSIWTEDYCPECGKPVDKCICDGDGYTNSNTNDVQEYKEPDEFKEEDKDDYVQIPKDYHIIVDDTKCQDCGELKECCRCEISCDDEK